MNYNKRLHLVTKPQSCAIGLEATSNRHDVHSENGGTSTLTRTLPQTHTCVVHACHDAFFRQWRGTWKRRSWRALAVGTSTCTKCITSSQLRRPSLFVSISRNIPMAHRRLVSMHWLTASISSTNCPPELRPEWYDRSESEGTSRLERPFPPRAPRLGPARAALAAGAVDREAGGGAEYAAYRCNRGISTMGARAGCVG